MKDYAAREIGFILLGWKVPIGLCHNLMVVAEWSGSGFHKHVESLDLSCHLTDGCLPIATGGSNTVGTVISTSIEVWGILKTI